MSNFCDLCAWETNEKVTRVGNDMWCETCIEAALPDEMENIFSMSADVKICRNCRHCKPDRSWLWFLPLFPAIPFLLRDQWRFAKCAAAEDDLHTTDELVGAVSVKKHLLYCTTERSVWGACKPGGLKFEARQ